MAFEDHTAVSCGSQAGSPCHPVPPGNRAEVTAMRRSCSDAVVSPKLACQAMPYLGTLTESGSVTYQVLVLATADDQLQPIRNVATIDSAETPPDDDDATVGVNPPPSVASPTPTLPATDTTGTGGGTSGGSGLALILLLAVGILGGIGILAPAPARRRMRDRD